jgi:hypothetical protein
MHLQLQPSISLKVQILCSFFALPKQTKDQRERTSTPNTSVQVQLANFTAGQACCFFICKKGPKICVPRASFGEFEVKILGNLKVYMESFFMGFKILENSDFCGLKFGNCGFLGFENEMFTGVW